jgi:hypothetical protein
MAENSEGYFLHCKAGKSQELPFFHDFLAFSSPAAKRNHLHFSAQKVQRQIQLKKQFKNPVVWKVHAGLTRRGWDALIKERVPGDLPHTRSI